MEELAPGGGAQLNSTGRYRRKQSRARAGRDASVRRSAAPTALWCSVPWPRRQLTARTAFAPFRQSRRSQFTRRAARAGHGPCAPRRLTGASQPARARLCGNARGVGPEHHRGHDLASGGTRQGRFLRRRGAQRQGRRAVSALRPHACRICLSAARQRVASYAARPRGEHRSGVVAKRRPPQHEPLAGAAWRDALNPARERPPAKVSTAPTAGVARRALVGIKQSILLKNSPQT